MLTMLVMLMIASHEVAVLFFSLEVLLLGLVANNNVLQVQPPKLNMLLLPWPQRGLFGYAIFLHIFGTHNQLQ
jgi:hypothetical protein